MLLPTSLTRMTAIATVTCGVLAAQPIPLFDGDSLDGWKVEGAAYWKAHDGVLLGESDHRKKNSILWTQRKFRDFVFECEFRFSGDIDSGIFLRDLNEQIQIGVSRSLKRDMTGSPYIASKRGYPAEAEGVEELLNPADWNHLRIVAKGPVYSVHLNGTHVLEYTSKSAPEKGPIGLQVHPGLVMSIEFRELKVKPLG